MAHPDGLMLWADMMDSVAWIAIHLKSSHFISDVRLNTDGLMPHMKAYRVRLLNNEAERHRPITYN